MISSVRIANFKCFEEETFPFQRLTFLSGLNGMGKSTVIQSLLLLRQSFEQRILPETGLALNGDLVSIGTSQDALCDFSDEDTLSIDVDFEANESLALQVRHDINADVMKRISPTPSDASFDSPLFSNDFQFVSSERTGPRTSYDMSEFAVRDRRSVGTRGEFTAHFLAKYGKLPIPNKQLTAAEADSENLVDQVNHWLGFISPGVRLQLEEHPNMDIVDVRFAYNRRHDVSNAFRSTNVGFGLSHTLPIIVATLAARPGSLLLFENPESNLHPQGQAKLGMLFSLAAQQGTQIAVESHSDHLLNGIRVSIKKRELSHEALSIMFFDRDYSDSHHKAVVRFPTVDENGKLTESPAGFFDEYEKQLFELL